MTTQRLPAPLAEPGAPIAPLDGSTLVLTPVSGDRRPHEFEPSTTAMFDQRLTRTGAMMGTPAYMAPEQFRGRATDARSDQFAFCVALYEALYGERPFGGNTLMALTTNVVNGRVREVPANVERAAWIRKILMRGLRVNADERFPSMEELLEALGKTRRSRGGVVGGDERVRGVMLLAVGLGFGMRQGMADPKPRVRRRTGEAGRNLGAPAPGAAETPRQAQLHEAFLKTGKSYAKDVWVTTSRSLTKYARAWVDMYKETCEAAVVNKVQSPEVMDLRMDCLNERLGGLRALTDVFATQTARSWRMLRARRMRSASLDRCADVPVLRAVVRPPEDYRDAPKVDDLRHRVAELKAKFDSGRSKESIQTAPLLVDEARKIGHLPLVAETLLLSGRVMTEVGKLLWRGGGARRSGLDRRGISSRRSARGSRCFPGLCRRAISVAALKKRKRWAKGSRRNPPPHGWSRPAPGVVAERSGWCARARGIAGSRDTTAAAVARSEKEDGGRPAPRRWHRRSQPCFRSVQARAE